MEEAQIFLFPLACSQPGQVTHLVLADAERCLKKRAKSSLVLMMAFLLRKGNIKQNETKE